MAELRSDATFLDSGFLFYCLERGVPFADILSRLADQGSFVVDVKTLQEIVYRYHLLGETQLGYEQALSLRKLAKVLPVTKTDLLQMDAWLDQFPQLGPRELLHLAVIQHHGIRSVACGPKSSYSQFPGVETRNLLGAVVPSL
jgi:hypothetical protein